MIMLFYQIDPPAKSLGCAFAIDTSCLEESAHALLNRLKAAIQWLLPHALRSRDVGHRRIVPEMHSRDEPLIRRELPQRRGRQRECVHYLTGGLGIARQDQGLRTLGETDLTRRSCRGRPDYGASRDE